VRRWVNAHANTINCVLALDDRVTVLTGVEMLLYMPVSFAYVFRISLPRGALASSATGSSDKSIHVWSLESNDRVKVLSGHYGDVLALAASANGYYYGNRLLFVSHHKALQSERLQRPVNQNLGPCIQHAAVHQVRE
jgi:WD40 repeat protein